MLDSTLTGPNRLWENHMPKNGDPHLAQAIYDGIFWSYAVVIATFVVGAETECGFIIKFSKVIFDEESPEVLWIFIWTVKCLRLCYLLAGSESRPPMLTKENYVPWSSRLLYYAKSRPNGKLIHNSIINGPYVRQMIPEPGDTNREVTVTETFHVQTDDELTEKELKQIEADDQAIQTILFGLPEDIYAVVDSFETAQEIWLRPEWSRHVTIVHQTKDLHTADYTQLYDFLKYNQKENYIQQPMSNPEDITDPTAAMNMALALMAKVFKLNYSSPTNNNQRISSSPRNRQIAQPGMNMVQDRQMQMVGGNANLNGNGNLVTARAEGNADGHNGNQIRCYNCRGVGHFARNYLDEIEEVNANCILMANLQQASTSGTQSDKAPVYDTNGSAEVHNYENYDGNKIFNMFTQEEQYTKLLEPIPKSHQVPQIDNNVISEVTSVEQSGETIEQHPVNFEETQAAKLVGDFKSLAKEADESLAKHKKLELEIEHLLKAVVSQDIISVVQKEFVVDTSDLQTELKRTKEPFENCIIKKENEYAKLWNDWYKKCDECKYDKISYDKAYNDMQQKIERLQAQLGDLKGKSKDTSCVSDTRNHLFSKLESKNVSDQKDNTCDTSANTKFAKQSIVENLPEVGETHALPKPVTSNSVSTPQESKVMKNDKVIALRMFRINPFKTYREEKHVPNTVRASARTKPITISQSFVFTKKDVNSDSNGFSSTGIDNTKTIRPQLISNTKHDRVPSVSKSSRSKNKEAEVEEHHRNLLLFKNNKHILFDQKGKIIDSSESESQSDYSNGDNACTSNTLEPIIKRFPNSTSLLGRVYFVEGLGHNLFSMGQFCDSNLEVAFRRNVCFVRNLEGVDLLKGDRSTNLYTINLHETASASPICLIARASSTKSWLWHQRLSHLNFDTINDLARNDLVSGLPKFKYHKEHLCPSCEQEKSKRASHPPKPVPNSRQRLHLLHIDLCRPMRIASINGKLYVLVIVDDYSHYKWVHFLRSKDETPEVIKTFLKRVTVLLQSPVIIIRTNNGTKFKNQVLNEYFDSVGISHQVSSVRTHQQNGVVERQNRTLVEAARTMLIFSRAPLFLWAEAIATACFTQNRSIIHRRFNKTPYELINGRKSNISFLHVFGALCYPKNDREDIGKLGAKGDIGFFIGYSADSCTYRVYNRRTKKIMETMNVSFDELSAMAFKQRSSKPELQSMTFREISSGLNLTYAPSTITTQQTTEEPQVRQTSMASTSIADTAPAPTNSSSHATNIPINSHDVDELNQNAMVDGNTFVNPFANTSTSAAESSSLQNDHSLEQVIEEPSRPILTRNQLRSDGDMCIYALTVSTMEPKNVKEAMTDPAWIESMQEELLQFKRIDVWMLVPAPDNISPL
nr:retrovirus-related Pol polyprotein from transposon TNT 1-94 [Tanacetum cinerariifolium]